MRAVSAYAVIRNVTTALGRLQVAGEGTPPTLEELRLDLVALREAEGFLNAAIGHQQALYASLVEEEEEFERRARDLEWSPPA